MADEDLVLKFQKLGFEDSKIKEIVKNSKVSTALSEIADHTYLEEDNRSFSKSIVSLLHSLAAFSKDAKSGTKPGRNLIVDAILDSRIKTTIQLEAAWKYVENVAKEEGSFAIEDLNEASGVGIEVTPDQVKAAVKQYIEEHKEDIEINRYKTLPSTLVNVKKISTLKWASPALFKPTIDAEYLAFLGPKDERDVVKKEKKPSATKKNGTGSAGSTPGSNTGDHNVRSMFTEGFLGQLHKPGGNPQKDPKLMIEHLKATSGRVFTRFPPEPNGYLHIGHSKAITVNFGYAQHYNGVCYLRYDDTNPEAEEEQFFTSIREIIDWLGFTPYKITYSSDYFDELYELAERLIEKGLAYVCYCTPEEVKASRGVGAGGERGGERIPCAHRSSSIESNLAEFRAMRDGKYQPGEATLRMKQDLSNPNPQMWDLVAYRVLNAPHHRTGDKWKIYPTYDFTHCLVDSFENISHSLCTTEFYLSRESYEWLCDAVDVYKPAQREYGRLNITGTILSKRKIAKLVHEGYVRGWDDPRLFTLVAVRRRGVPPAAILNFVAQLGVTTSNSNIQVVRFESSVRKFLEDSTPRLMMIPDPVPVILTNLPEDHLEEFEVPFKPGNIDMGEHKVPFTRTVYVDRSDFREEASKDYFRLAPGQSVGLLKVPHNIRVTSYEKDDEGKVKVIYAHYENDIPFKKPKTFIQWVASAPSMGSPIKLSEVRLFSQLFKSESPESNPKGFLADINPDSETVITNAIIEVGFNYVKDHSPWTTKGISEELSGKETKGAPESVRFQALRVGYFCMDRDTKDDAIVLNRIVTLKEDSSKS